MKLVVQIKTNLELTRKRDNLWGCAERLKGNRVPHENVETNDPLVSMLVPLEKQVVRQQHLRHIILYCIWREPARFFSPSLIKSGSQWKHSAHNSPDRVKGTIVEIITRTFTSNPTTDFYLRLRYQFFERRCQAGIHNYTFSWQKGT